MRYRSGVVALILGAVFTVTNAQATIISGNVMGGSAEAAGGTFIKLKLPLANPFGLANSVGKNTYQSPNLYGFDEAQSILLSADLAVDIGGTIAAGTLVSSHYIFFDPRYSETILGTVDFGAEVLGILTTTSSLFATDWLAGTGVNYLNPPLRGLEAGDIVDISGKQQITFQTQASTPGDYVRVLTLAPPAPSALSRVVAVPEPATLPLFGTALAGFWFAKRRNSRPVKR